MGTARAWHVAPPAAEAAGCTAAWPWDPWQRGPTPAPAPTRLGVEQVGGAVRGQLARHHYEQLVHGVALAHQLHLRRGVSGP